jgi:hypothetical protein
MTDKPKTMLWTRREAILKASAMLGGTALIGQAMMLAGCERLQTSAPLEEVEPRDGLFSNAELELLTEMAETILPETDTPGAKAAGVGPFIALMVTDCYSPEEQQTFKQGLATIDQQCQQEYGSNFVDSSPTERLAVAERLDRQQVEANNPAHYFRMFKQLTVLGFYTSELAYDTVLEYVESPGRYDGCRDLGPDVRMFAGHGSSPYST